MAKKTGNGVKSLIPDDGAKQMKMFTEEDAVRNDLSSLLGFQQSNPFQVGFGVGGSPISEVDTLMKNQRWYLISNMRQVISQAYVEIGLVQRVVDIPVNDAFRGGVQLHSSQLSEDEMHFLKKEFKKDLRKLKQAYKWNRLFGGAGVVIMNGAADFAKPFEMGQIKQGSLLDFRAVDLWELFWSKQNVNDFAQVVDGPGMQTPEMYDYYGHQLHNTRALRMVGVEAPSFIRPRLRGWGLSMLETLIRGMNQYLKATNLTFEVLDEFKIDVFKIKNFASALMTAQGEQALHRRLAIANMEKNYQHALTMDMEDDYQQKQISFTGLAEVMAENRNQIASECNIPQSKLFGTGSKGFSSGEDDLENYNSMVEGEVREPAHPELIQMAQMRSIQMFGYAPDDLDATFNPLRVLSAKDEEEVKTHKFNRLLGAATALKITDEEFREGCNKDKLLPNPLEKNVELPKPEATGEGEGEKE